MAVSSMLKSVRRLCPNARGFLTNGAGKIKNVNVRSLKNANYGRAPNCLTTGTGLDALKEP